MLRNRDLHDGEWIYPSHLVSGAKTKSKWIHLCDLLGKSQFFQCDKAVFLQE